MIFSLQTNENVDTRNFIAAVRTDEVCFSGLVRHYISMLHSPLLPEVAFHSHRKSILGLPDFLAGALRAHLRRSAPSLRLPIMYLAGDTL